VPVAGEAVVGHRRVGRRGGGERAERVVGGQAAADEAAVDVAESTDVAQAVGQDVVEGVAAPLDT
jgi:hypothetical protein